VAPGLAPSLAVKKRLSKAANILLTNIGNKLYNQIITNNNDNNGLLIWTCIKELFAQRTGLCLSRCLTQWHKLCYKGNLSDYLDWVETCLALFDLISYVQDGSAICGVITLALSEQRGSFINPILTNDVLMNNPVLLMTKLCDIACNEQTCKKPPHSETLATAMSTTNSCTRTCSGCHGKKHNPVKKTHSNENCWAIYPHKREEYLASQHHTVAVPSTQAASSSQHQVPAFAAITSAHCHLSRASGTTTVLNSGASHHMFNCLEFFEDTNVCSIPISTGRDSTNLIAIQVHYKKNLLNC
jgi:hypothetical protein